MTTIVRLQLDENEQYQHFVVSAQGKEIIPPQHGEPIVDWFLLCSWLSEQRNDPDSIIHDPIIFSSSIDDFTIDNPQYHWEYIGVEGKEMTFLTDEQIEQLNEQLCNNSLRLLVDERFTSFAKLKQYCLSFA